MEKLRYLLVDRSRHGKTRFYVRLPGKKMIRLQVDSRDDPNLGIAYAAALNGEEWRQKRSSSITTEKAAKYKVVKGSLRALCEMYYAYLAEERQLTSGTKYTRRKHLEDICLEPPSPGSPLVLGDIPLRLFSSAHVYAIMDRKRAKPEASNGRRKALNALFGWAIPRGQAASNPARAVSKIKTNSEGYRTWTMEEVDRFVTVHPLGTRAHLAMALLLYTGQRRSDVIRFGRQHVKNGAIHFVQQKHERTSHKSMRIPIIPALREVLEQVPRDQLTFLVTAQGKPFTAAGFGNWFRDVCDNAGLKGLSAHGLRKALQSLGANAGLSDRQLMAIAGHELTRMTSLYTKKRDRDQLADSGMRMLSAAQFENDFVAPADGVQKSATNRVKNPS